MRNIITQHGEEKPNVGVVLASYNTPGPHLFVRYDVAVQFSFGQLEFQNVLSDYPHPEDIDPLHPHDVHAFPVGGRFLVDWDGNNALLMIPWFPALTACEEPSP